ncbi:ribose-phosphate pyrophosphokinase [Patescibacteria group bacterium]|nr:ribose-phosphate pyrophosphokinase [Patescibacteria group bacterium]
MYIFGGSASKVLAKKIATHSKDKLGDVEVTVFANGEMRVWVKTKNVGHSAIIVQSLSIPVNGHIVEFCLLADALYRLGVHEITAVVPWLGYSKQDKVFRKGESLSIKVIANLMQTTPLSRLLTFDLHNLAILGFFDIPVVNLSARPLFVKHFKPTLSPKTIVVAPDAGAIKNSTEFAGELDVPVAYIDKHRDRTTGAVTVHGISRPVDGTDIIILDDMIVTGATLMETAKYLKHRGAGSIAVAATHYLSVPGVAASLEKSDIDAIVITDTIALPDEDRTEKFQVLSVAPVLAGELG